MRNPVSRPDALRLDETRLSSRKRTHRIKPLRVWKFLATACAIASTISPVWANPFGEIVQVSAIGQPFEVVIKTQGIPANRILDCVTFPPQPTTAFGIETLHHPLIAVRQQGTATYLVIRQPQMVAEPIVMFTLLERCTSQLQRSYTVLLDAPLGLVSAAPVAELPARATSAKSATPPPEDLPPPARTSTPPARPPHPTRTATQDTASRQAVQGTTASVPTAVAPPHITTAPTLPHPRLRIDGSEDEVRLAVPGTRSPQDATEHTDESIQAREERIVLAIDRTIKLQLEIFERLQRLEAIQAGLNARLNGLPQERQANQHDNFTHTAVARRATPAADDEAIPERPAPAANSQAPASTSETPSLTRSTWALLGALMLALLAAAGYWRLRRQQASLPDATASKPSATATTPNPAVAASAAPDAPTETLTLLQDDTATDSLQTARSEGGRSNAEALSDTLPSLILHESDPTEEHDSAVELAEIMISFGRVHGAAETLADFIRTNPKQAITPWLKLLEVYRLAGMRIEFDALSRQLNKTFNVKTVTWDNFDQARSTYHQLEDMPHIIHTLTETWGTRACQRYLETLLRDNRDGAREGFPIAIIDEILLLAAILEEQLGRYRSDANDANDASGTTPDAP